MLIWGTCNINKPTNPANKQIDRQTIRKININSVLNMLFQLRKLKKKKNTAKTKKLSLKTIISLTFFLPKKIFFEKKLFHQNCKKKRQKKNGLTAYVNTLFM